MVKYENPILRGMYPDPSVCKVNNKYYMVCSSMHLFPGIPLFESDDLINWRQIGHCLTRKSQIDLNHIPSSGGVFAPTIRFNKGRFYVVTTNSSYNKNFYVFTDDIYGEWSEPIYVDQDGIDPSLYFEDDKTYFMSNGNDGDTIVIHQCEIDIKTGRKLTEGKSIWSGAGGRFLEGPHLYKINGMYYILAAEGGTEYGHMITYARGKTPYGPFEGYKNNPVLTNRNLGGEELQGMGHGDLIEDNYGNYWLLHLGFRQAGKWVPYHHLGREVFLTPVKWSKDGWFTAGVDGTVKKYFEVSDYPNDIKQYKSKEQNFSNTKWSNDWCYIRIPEKNNYQFKDNVLKLLGTDISINDIDSPTFIGVRQKEFDAIITCDVDVSEGEAGISIYMDEDHHYDLFIEVKNNKKTINERLCIGDIKSKEKSYEVSSTNPITLRIDADRLEYSFSYIENEKLVALGKARAKYLSSEVAGGFTGVIIGLYSTGNGVKCTKVAEFKNFSCKYI